MYILEKMKIFTRSFRPLTPFRPVLAACLAGLVLCLAVLTGLTPLKGRPVRAEGGGGDQEARDSIVTGLVNRKSFDFEGPLESRTASLKVLYDGGSKDLLHYRQGETVYIASLTKIMTGYCAYNLLRESGRELGEKVSVSSADLKGLAELNASVAGFQAGEKVTFTDLFYGLFLSSGCDAANSLARESAGSLETFVDHMNLEASRLGLTATHFANTTGLFHVDNYGTADDMASLLAKACEIDFLRQVMETRHYTTEATEMHPQGIALVHSLLLYGTEAGLDSQPIDGGKTGQLKESGYCLASFKELGDCLLVLCTTGAEDPGGHVRDHLAIYQAFIDQYSPDEDCLITGIGEGVPLRPESPEEEADQEGEEGTSAPSPAAALTAISALLLAVLVLLSLILLASALLKRRMEKTNPPE